MGCLDFSVFASLKVSTGRKQDNGRTELSSCVSPLTGTKTMDSVQHQLKLPSPQRAEGFREIFQINNSVIHHYTPVVIGAKTGLDCWIVNK